MGRRIVRRKGEGSPVVEAPAPSPDPDDVFLPDLDLAPKTMQAPTRYVIAPGKSIVSRVRGVLGPGSVVTIEDCSDLEGLTSAGYLLAK